MNEKFVLNVENSACPLSVINFIAVNSYYNQWYAKVSIDISVL